jgi:hypothetical protein
MASIDAHERHTHTHTHTHTRSTPGSESDHPPTCGRTCSTVSWAVSSARITRCLSMRRAAISRRASSSRWLYSRATRDDRSVCVALALSMSRRHTPHTAGDGVGGVAVIDDGGSGGACGVTSGLPSTAGVAGESCRRRFGVAAILIAKVCNCDAARCFKVLCTRPPARPSPMRPVQERVCKHFVGGRRGRAAHAKVYIRLQQDAQQIERRAEPGMRP